MHDGDHRRQDEGDAFDRSGSGASEPSTERVRIIGAEPAGEATAVVPVVSTAGDPPWTASGPAESGLGRDAGEEAGAPGPDTGTTELPHWTEPPTGQVPAVLDRGSGDDDERSGISAPTWREEQADWLAHDEEFEPAMLGGDDTALGSLDETDDADADRRPWEFDLPGHGAGPSSGGWTREAGGYAASDPVTEPVPVRAVGDDPYGADLGPDEGGAAGGGEPEHSGHPGSRRRASWDDELPPGGMVHGEDGAADEDGAAGDTGGEVDPEDAARPTGVARIGRSRRGGARPTRLRAKRPLDVELADEPPLAAEPPGASVADVPGAGRRRGGLAGLAAADRTADRGLRVPADGADAADGGDGGDGADGAGGAGRAGGQAGRAGDARDSRRVRPSRPPMVPGGPLGGGPPRRPDRPPGRPGRTSRTTRTRGSGMTVRIGTGLAAAAVALVAFASGTVASLVLVIAVVTFAAGEAFGVLRRAGYRPATLLGLVGTVSLLVAAYTKGPTAVPLVLALIVAFTLLWYLFGIERGAPVAGASATLLTVGWISLLGSYAGLLLSPSLFPGRHGIAFLLGAIIATVANDVGALLVGSWVGRHPLAPRISPNKTWEGFFGGALASVAVSAAVVGQIHPWTPGRAALLGVVVAVVGPIGDLCESMLKRDLKLKDMGRLLPGHGGVLDRVDALLFVLPATYYLVRALNIG